MTTSITSPYEYANWLPTDEYVNWLKYGPFPPQGEFADSTQFQIDGPYGIEQPPTAFGRQGRLPSEIEYNWETGLSASPGVSYADGIDDHAHISDGPVTGQVPTDIVYIRSIPHKVSYPMSKKQILSLFPNSIFANIIRSNPGVENIDIPETFVDPNTLNFLYQIANTGKVPEDIPYYNELDRIGKYLKIDLLSKLS